MVSRGNIDPKWLSFVKETFKRNLNPDVYRDANRSTYSNVVAMVANTRGARVVSDDHQAKLAFAKVEQGSGRCVRAINMIAEIDGVQGRLVDSSATFSNTFN